MAITLSEKLKLLKIFLTGFRHFEKTGETPREAWLALRKLYVETNGRFNDIFHTLYTLNKPPVPVVGDLKNSLFRGVTAQDMAKAVTGLRRDGFYVFPQRLDAAYCDALMKFALETPTVLQYDNESRAQKQKGNTENGQGMFYMGHAVETEDVYFDPANLIATNYRYREEAVVNNPAVQDLMADPLMLGLAQQYMKSFAMYTIVGMWWTTPYGCDEASSTLAQLYHFDMDRIKFINFFLYLTDVGPQDGPHCYVRGSCDKKPKELIRDGRIPDHEVHAYYGEEDRMEFTGPRGTLIVEDARGWHKAKMPTRGNRLALEFELSSCLFGPEYPNSTIEVKSPLLKDVVDRYPGVLNNLKVVTGKKVDSRERVERVPVAK